MTDAQTLRTQMDRMMPGIRTDRLWRRRWLPIYIDIQIQFGDGF